MIPFTSSNLNLNSFSLLNGTTGVAVYSGNPILNGLVIRDQTEYGVFVDEGTPTISSTLIANSTRGVYVSADNAKVVYCTVTNNSERGLHVSRPFTPPFPRCHKYHRYGKQRCPLRCRLHLQFKHLEQ